VDHAQLERRSPRRAWCGGDGDAPWVAAPMTATAQPAMATQPKSRSGAEAGDRPSESARNEGATDDRGEADRPPTSGPRHAVPPRIISTPAPISMRPSSAVWFQPRTCSTRLRQGPIEPGLRHDGHDARASDAAPAGPRMRIWPGENPRSVTSRPPPPGTLLERGVVAIGALDAGRRGDVHVVRHVPHARNRGRVPDRHARVEPRLCSRTWSRVVRQCTSVRRRRRPPRRISSIPDDARPRGSALVRCPGLDALHDDFILSRRNSCTIAASSEPSPRSRRQPDPASGHCSAHSAG